MLRTIITFFKYISAPTPEFGKIMATESVSVVNATSIPTEYIGQKECLIVCDAYDSYITLSKAHMAILFAASEDNRQELSLFADECPHYVVEDYLEAPADYYIKIYERFVGIPWDIMSTARCNVREMCPSDIDDMYELYEDKSVCRFMEDLFDNRDVELKYINDYIKNIYDYYGFGTWNIYRSSDGRLIGRAGFNYRPDFDSPELGFMIGAKYQHEGYAYEVCHALMELARTELGFDKIYALVHPDNHASLKLLDKLGFIPDSERPCVEITQEGRGSELLSVFSVEI